MRPLRVLIADDNDIAREFLSALAGSEPDVEVVGLANNGLEAVSRASALVPDVVIMDVEMPRMDGLEAAQILKRKLPTVGILHVSGYGGYEWTSIAAGADGFLAKPFDGGKLVSELRRIAAKYC